MRFEVRVDLPSPSPFQKLVFSRISMREYADLREAIGGYKLTMILNDPGRASNNQLVAIANAIGIPAWELINEYKVGCKITEAEKEQHRRLYEYEKQKAVS